MSFFLESKIEGPDAGMVSPASQAMLKKIPLDRNPGGSCARQQLAGGIEDRGAGK